MFSGIIIATGKVTRVEMIGGDMRATINAGGMDMTDVAIGDSISINGACMTVISLTATTFSVDISAESLSCTTLGKLAIGTRVNLEKALQANARLHGHIVTGHIDGVGTIVSATPDARSIRYVVQVPETLQRYVCKKGSICIDGVSLTVNDVKGADVGVNLIPHTLEQTILADYHDGTEVNIEVDIIARYLERLQAAS